MTMQSIIIAIFSFVGAGVGTLIFQMLFEVWKFDFATKRGMKKTIIELCAEGYRARYKEPPENDKVIFELLNHLESKQSNMRKPLEDYCNFWNITQFTAKRARSQEDNEYVLRLVTDADKCRKVLLQAVEEW